MAGKYFYIKERHNPQLGVYYVPQGQITVKKAKRMEDSIYGVNIIHRFDTKEAYQAAIDRLKAAGEKVQA